MSDQKLYYNSRQQQQPTGQASGPTGGGNGPVCVFVCVSGPSKRRRRRKLITCAYGQLIPPEEEECLSAFIINSAVDKKSTRQREALHQLEKEEER